MAKLVKTNNGRQWETQKAALAYFKSLLHRYSNGGVVDDAVDIDDLTALLITYDKARSAEEPAKVGNGINHFKKLKISGLGWSTDGFWVFHNDESSTDFSYIDAVKCATIR
jgi:hydrogenase maturation factor HypE